MSGFLVGPGAKVRLGAEIGKKTVYSLVGLGTVHGQLGLVRCALIGVDNGQVHVQDRVGCDGIDWSLAERVVS